MVDHFAKFAGLGNHAQALVASDELLAKNYFGVSSEVVFLVEEVSNLSFVAQLIYLYYIGLDVALGQKGLGHAAVRTVRKREHRCRVL